MSIHSHLYLLVVGLLPHNLCFLPLTKINPSSSCLSVLHPLACSIPTHSVFNIALILSKGRRLQKAGKDLFSEYSLITKERVAKCYEWYYTWPIMDSHITKRLWGECLEVYESNPPNAHGRPLIFIIMIKKLVGDMEATMTIVQGTIEKIKILRFLPCV